MKTNVEKNDDELQLDVLSELKFDPSVKVSDIGVLVKDGTVTLKGNATSYGERFAAVRSTQRVAGVKAIADNIEVKLVDSSKRTDGEIATAAMDQINLNSSIPKGIAEVIVRDGWITLQGEFGWGHEKRAAEIAVQHLDGVTGVSNLITIKPTHVPSEIESDITSAMARNVLLESDNIQVELSEGAVILRGKVRNYTEREEAERIAWAAPGVSAVDNQIRLE